MTPSTTPGSSAGTRLRTVLIALLLGAIATPAVAQNDLSVTAVSTPQSGCSLTATENVTVRIFNYGATLPAGTAFNASYEINAGVPATEMIVLASNLLSNSVLTYTFVTPADLSVPGAYSFDAAVSVPGDVSPANDAFTGYVVTNSAASVGGSVSQAPTGSSGTLTLSGQTGNVVQWEESDDGGLRWFALSDQSTSLSYAGLRTSTQFRARVRNGACADALSNTVTATP